MNKMIRFGKSKQAAQQPPNNIKNKSKACHDVVDHNMMSKQKASNNGKNYHNKFIVASDPQDWNAQSEMIVTIYRNNNSNRTKVQGKALPGWVQAKSSARIANENSDSLKKLVLVSKLKLFDPCCKRYAFYTGYVCKTTGMPFGKGRLDYGEDSAGSYYEGCWEDGVWEGPGKYRDFQGNEYEGEFHHGCMNGNGTKKFAKGKVFKGEFKHGRMFIGDMNYKDGTKYRGYFEDGMRHGRGRYLFKDGSVFDGEFVKDAIDGHGRMTWPDGGWYLGEWSNGEMHGVGKNVSSDGTVLFDGMWERGDPVVEANP